MGFAGLDDAFQLGVGQQALGDHLGRQMRPVAGLGRRHRRHGGRLHEPGRMRHRARNADRLQRIALIQRLGDAAGLRGSPVDRLVGEFDAAGRNRRGGRKGSSPDETGTRRGRRPRRASGLGPRIPRTAPQRQAAAEPAGSPSPAAWQQSGAMPIEAGNSFGSSAGTRSMTVRRVSVVVPWRA